MTSFISLIYCYKLLYLFTAWMSVCVYTCMSVCMYMCVRVCMQACVYTWGGTAYTLVLMWRSEHSLQKSVLPFHHADCRNLIQAARLGSKCLYPLTHPVNLRWHLKYIESFDSKVYSTRVAIQVIFH